MCTHIEQLLLDQQCEVRDLDCVSNPNSIYKSFKLTEPASHFSRIYNGTKFKNNKGMVDGAQTEGKINEAFSRKYDCLYYSVLYNKSDRSLLQDDISKSVSSHHHDSGRDRIFKRGVSVNLVEQTM